MRKMVREKESEIKAAIEELSFLHHPPSSSDHHHQGGDGAGAPAPSVRGDRSHPRREVSNIPSRPFLALCHLILQVLDKIGPTMAVLRQDMSQNIQRLELQIDTDPAKYSNLIEILTKEAAEGSARNRDSCSRGLLWLTRSLDFKVALLESIARDPSQSMEQVVEESYNLTLKPWHGWISSAAYKVALKLLPDNRTFIELLASKGQNFSTLREEIQSLVALLVPLLEDVHFVLGIHGLDRLKCT